MKQKLIKAMSILLCWMLLIATAGCSASNDSENMETDTGEVTDAPDAPTTPGGIVLSEREERKLKDKSTPDNLIK